MVGVTEITSKAIITQAVASPITIAGSVNVTQRGNGPSEFDLWTDSKNSDLTISGSVTYDNHLNIAGIANVNGDSNVIMYGSMNVTNSYLSILGSLNLSLANTSNKTAGDNAYAANSVSIGSNVWNATGIGTIVSGKTTIVGSNGLDTVGIDNTKFNQSLTIDLKSNPGNVLGSQYVQWDLLQIGGCTFDGPVSVTMSGKNATIEIDDGVWVQPTIFNRPFTATMTDDPVVIISPGSGSNYSNRRIQRRRQVHWQFSGQGNARRFLGARFRKHHNQEFYDIPNVGRSRCLISFGRWGRPSLAPDPLARPTLGSRRRKRHCYTIFTIIAHGVVGIANRRGAILASVIL